MVLRWVSLLLCLLLGTTQFTSLHEFKSLDYVFSSPAERDASLKNGTYDPTQNIPTCVRVWNNTVFMAVPRISGHGVPFTLVTIQGKKLSPYPNAHMNWLGNPAGLRSVYAMEIDSLDRLWVLDSGRAATSAPTASNASGSVGSSGYASLFIIDLQTTKLLHVFIFSDPIVSFTNSLLQDLALDQTHSVAYISDRGGSGALIVYDLNTNAARRFIAPSSMRAKNDSVIFINDVPYPSISWAITGVALSSDAETLYFTPVNSESIYKVSCSKLRDYFTTSNGQVQTSMNEINITQLVSEAVVKSSQSSRLMGSNQQHVYFGLLSENAIGRFYAGQSDVEIMYPDDAMLQWVDSISFDQGAMYVLSNRMHRYWNSSMNWEETNFRVLKVATLNNEDTYLKGQKPLAPTPSPAPASSNSLVEDAVVAVSAAVIGMALGALFTSCFMRPQRWDQRLLAGHDTGWSVSDPHRAELEPRESASHGVRASHLGAHPSKVGQSGTINASLRDKSGWLFSE